MNEYEGVIEGVADGIGPVITYVQTSGERAWQALSIGQIAQVEIHFERQTKITPKVVSTDTTPMLKLNKNYGYERVDGYELTCRVARLGREDPTEDPGGMYVVDQPFQMEIDMDYGVNEHERPALRVGDLVHVIGFFKLEFAGDLDYI